MLSSYTAMTDASLNYVAFSEHLDSVTPDQPQTESLDGNGPNRIEDEGKPSEPGFPAAPSKLILSVILNLLISIFTYLNIACNLKCTLRYREAK